MSGFSAHDCTTEAYYSRSSSAFERHIDLERKVCKYCIIFSSFVQLIAAVQLRRYQVAANRIEGPVASKRSGIDDSTASYVVNEELSIEQGKQC